MKKSFGHFDFHLFDELNLEVFYGDKDLCWEEIKKSFYTQEKDVDCGEQITNNNGGSFYYIGHDPKIWLYKLPSDPKSFGVAAHEATHIVDWLCEVTGIDDKEFRGYMVGNIVRMLGVATKKYKKPKK